MGRVGRRECYRSVNAAEWALDLPSPAIAPIIVVSLARLAATDRLIDLIVYRLYGLTAEEVAIVEGK